jgi:hypothetical protein
VLAQDSAPLSRESTVRMLPVKELALLLVSISLHLLYILALSCFTTISFLDMVVKLPKLEGKDKSLLLAASYQAIC